MPTTILTPFNEYIRQNSGRLHFLQNPEVIWMTGLSGAGKTTLALALEKVLIEKGFFAIVLDGDMIRNGINNDLGYTDSDRMENIRRTAEIAKLFVDQGLIVICSFITPQKMMRELARNIIGTSRFTEVFVNCPIEVCERRDIKGLYQRARQGLISEFTGITSPYEVPESPDIEINTDTLDIGQSVDFIMSKVMPFLNLNNPD